MVDYAAKVHVAYYRLVTAVLSDCDLNVTGMLRSLESKLQSACENVIWQISSKARKRGRFVPHQVIIKSDFRLRIEVVYVSEAQS